MSLFSEQMIAGLRYMTCLLMKNPLGQVRCVRLFKVTVFNLHVLHRMDKFKSFVFARQYRNCFARRINAMVPRNQPIKTAIGMVAHDFHGFKTMTFHHVVQLQR